MKTTNYQISKQLAEAGFKAKSIFGWHVDGKECAPAYPLSPTATGYFWSYDLETILESLPRRIELRKMGKDGVIYELRACFQRSYSEGFKESNYFGYQNFQGFHQELCFMQQENESLADTAARLWLKLKQAGLV